MSFTALWLVHGYPVQNFNISKASSPVSRNPMIGFTSGIRKALSAMRRKEVIRWLVFLGFGNLTLDIFHGYIALYFVDIVGFEDYQASYVVTVWIGLGLLSDFLLIPLLEKMHALRYLMTNALMVFVLLL